MKTRESIAIATVSVFEAGNYPFVINRSSARQIFASDYKNYSNVALAMPFTIFMSICQKFVSRRMDIIYKV